HPDHVGGVRELLDGDRIEVFVHPADLEGVSLTLREALSAPQGGTVRGHLLQYMTPHPGAATALRDGDVLPILGGMEVIHTPGHTPGSVCLYARAPRVLFTGDVLQVRFGRLAFASPIFSHDHAQARASVHGLAQLDVDIIAFSHYRPMREGASAALAGLADQAAAGGSG
ncbi:MAG: MBL fold metallo-hydrolase, partial [Candidatus Limnocylindria bacterium]